ncbi:MAG TPA: hypothetical protein VFV68_13280, partial [Agriterribacter sp.]|nr:hypothetical protein [Agriterribacter sp.]
MKPIKKIFPVLFIIITALLITAQKNKITTNENHFDATNIIGCAPNAGNDVYAGPDGKFITILPGWG